MNANPVDSGFKMHTMFTYSYWLFNPPFIVRVNGALYEAREPVQPFMFTAINKNEKTSGAADLLRLKLVEISPNVYGRQYIAG